MEINPNNWIGHTVRSPLGSIVLDKVLGHGSFAVVYLGIGKKQTFAVKVLFKHNLTDKQIEIQKQECQLHQKVSAHPHVVTLHCVLEDEDCVYLVLDYWKDGDLFDALVNENSAFTDPRTCLELFLQLVSAIQYCHRKGVYHRDLKPENILLKCINGRYSAALADFGLATDSLWSNEFACGSVRYMSPECLNDQGEEPGYITSANDVWALGIILINFLTMKNPWTEPSKSDPLFEEWSSGTQVSLFIHQFNFSKEINDIIIRCFELNYKKRISVDELYQSVSNILKSNVPIYGSGYAVDLEPVPSISSWADEPFQMDLEHSKGRIQEPTLNNPLASKAPKKKKKGNRRKKPAAAPAPSPSKTPGEIIGNLISRIFTLNLDENSSQRSKSASPLETAVSWGIDVKY